MKGFPTLQYFPIEKEYETRNFKYTKARDIPSFKKYLMGGWVPANEDL